HRMDGLLGGLASNEPADRAVIPSCVVGMLIAIPRLAERNSWPRDTRLITPCHPEKFLAIVGGAAIRRFNESQLQYGRKTNGPGSPLFGTAAANDSFQPGFQR